MTKSRYVVIAVNICFLLSFNNILYPSAAFGDRLSQGLRQRRQPGTHYKSHIQLLQQTEMKKWQNRSTPKRSVLESRIYYSDLDKTSVKATMSAEQLNSGFFSARDSRFLEDPHLKKFNRRSSWLYPDDGCFARADLARANLAQWGYPTPQKIFVFGDLQAQTANAPEGYVTWWYHVAPVVKVANEIFVFDPSIEPRQPLKLEDWLDRMSPGGEEFEIAICDQYTYDPADNCIGATDSHKKAQSDQIEFLELEWNRQIELGRDPNLVLGEMPPWLIDGLLGLFSGI